MAHNELSGRAKTSIQVGKLQGNISFLRQHGLNWPAAAFVVLVAAVAVLVLLSRERGVSVEISASPTAPATSMTVPASSANVAVPPSASSTATPVPSRHEPASPPSTSPPPTTPACDAGLTPVFSGDNQGCMNAVMRHPQDTAVWSGGGRTTMVVGKDNRLFIADNHGPFVPLDGSASGGGVFFHKTGPSTGYFRLYGTDGQFYQMNFTENPGHPAMHTSWAVAR